MGNVNPVVGMAWFSICVCLPLTFVVFLFACWKARRGQVPVYYINLLIANLIQLFSMIDWVVQSNGVSFISLVLFHLAAIASLGFRMGIALERYCFIAFPHFEYIRQTKGSVLFCTTVWGVCFIMVPIPLAFNRISTSLLAILPAPVFIICLAETIRLMCQAAPFATLVPNEDKQRILGTLIVLMLNYSLMIFPYAIVNIVFPIFNLLYYFPTGIGCLYQFSSFMDLILFTLTLKGPIDKLLGRLCCCSMAYPVVHASAPMSV